MEWYYYVIAFVGSAFGGVINTLAGNGSAVTLLILMELIGLPANLANGTNRVGVFAQTSVGAFAFYRNGKLDLARSWLPICLIVLGAIAGVIVAIKIDNAQFKQVFKYMMLVMLVVILVNPKRWLIESDLTKKLPLWISIPAFLALGFYGGFIQMGMGIFFLAVMVLMAKYSMIEANAVKLFVIGVYTFFVLAVFQYQGLIDWKIGLFMAVGQTIGGWLTANYASQHPQANIWAHRLLVVAVVLGVVKMFCF